MPFDYGRSGTRRNPFSPSLDQIRPGGGYTKSNTRVVLTAINIALAEWGLEQYLSLAVKALERARKP